ncbi:MAG: lipase family protein [Halofilum sp. (in: g-proteobacteria)]|nr:lipase family protein [Halofilum sp. (in: g-proteobacteria)]
MSSIVSDLTTGSEQVAALRGMSIPSHRQAYSDRTAWIMACLSELAYLRFTGLFSSAARKQYFLDNLERLVDGLGEQRVDKLRHLVDVLGYDPGDERAELEKGLAVLDLTLEEVFDSDGTQAILVSCEAFAALAFRGTEAMSVKDIKTDARASVSAADTGGQIHSGFQDAFKAVEEAIQRRLDEGDLDDRPLFVTGHSLGGALATIAARELTHAKGVAACYTFGSPRVGDEKWIWQLKTGIYRVVNAADCVTMLPPGRELIATLAWLLGFVPGVGTPLRDWLVARYGHYLHAGDMRYLTNCPPGQYEGVHLLYAVSWFFRIKAWAIKGLPWRRFLADHSIAVYRRKLMIVARVRNT